MKKIMLAVGILSIFAVAGPAHAKCGGAGARVGEYDTGTVKVGSVTIFAERFGELVAGPAQVCGNGSAGTIPISGALTITDASGNVLCHRNDVMGVDPFGFGVGVHSGGATHDADCGADISWSDLAPSFGVDPSDVGAGPGGVHAGVRKYPGEFDPATTAVPTVCSPPVPPQPEPVPTPGDPVPPWPPSDPTCVSGTSTGGTTGSYWLQRDHFVPVPAGTAGYLTRGAKLEIEQ